MMARKLTSQEVSSLFERKLSERSGLVKDVRSAEFILREYETATVTKFCCSKSTDKGFGNTGERPIFLSYAIVLFPSCNFLGLMKRSLTGLHRLPCVVLRLRRKSL